MQVLGVVIPHFCADVEGCMRPRAIASIADITCYSAYFMVFSQSATLLFHGGCVINACRHMHAEGDLRGVIVMSLGTFSEKCGLFLV